MALTSRQRQFLKALGHHRDPIIRVGHQGVTEALAAEMSRALRDHELVKVRAGETAGEDAGEVLRALADATGSEVVQVMGRNGLLYLRPKENPRIHLPGVPVPRVRDDEAPRRSRRPAKKVGKGPRNRQPSTKRR